MLASDEPRGEVAIPGHPHVLVVHRSRRDLDLVRERVVEAFGRMAAPPTCAVLLQPLKDRSAAVRRTAAWSLEASAPSHAMT